jgi:hypothetical protein
LRKLAAIMLLGLFLFNWGGYQLFHAYVQHRANNQLEAQLDDNRYNNSQLISIKISAANLPYYTYSQQFERVDGQLEIEGVVYKYVKRRIFNDSLELLCIPNQKEMKLTVARNNFFKLINDLQQGTQDKKTGSNPNMSKIFSADFCHFQEGFQFCPFEISISNNPTYLFQKVPQVYLLAAGQPPDNA